MELTLDFKRALRNAYHTINRKDREHRDLIQSGKPKKGTKMRRLATAALLLAWLVPSPASAASPHPIRLVKTDAARVEIYAGEALVASYHYGIGLHKPILHPLRSPRGHRITRAFPMEFGVPGEQTDHWQHEGVFLTYRNVNGVDFWSKFPPRETGPAADGSATQASPAWRAEKRASWGPPPTGSPPPAKSC